MRLSEAIPEKLTETLLKRPLLQILIAVNLAGTLFGVYYYIPQLSATEFYLWPLIADSPIATLLLSASLYILLSGGLERLSEDAENLIHALAFIGNIKYGLWTVFVLLQFRTEFMAINTLPMYIFLILSHLGMFLQAFLVLDYIDVEKKVLGLAAGFFLLNDMVDYSLGVHTSLPEAQGLYSIVFAVAFALTVVSSLLLYFEALER
ncbi:DUF1405 domain-containing protein [Candidatus Nanosalina sp. VS9-1]|uniref:DUF1405 domain-containing protein n=1 Tax=Candidatus Nanosalina sp. VS9-1 TaxID=3388566 RepID=UPI0039DF5737